MFLMVVLASSNTFCAAHAHTNSQTRPCSYAARCYGDATAFTRARAVHMVFPALSS